MDPHPRAIYVLGDKNRKWIYSPFGYFRPRGRNRLAGGSSTEITRKRKTLGVLSFFPVLKTAAYMAEFIRNVKSFIFHKRIHLFFWI
jgi:hypothetical protein